MRVGSKRSVGWEAKGITLPYYTCIRPCRFHCPDQEWTRGTDPKLVVHEGDQLSASEYRSRLYKVLNP